MLLEHKGKIYYAILKFRIYKEYGMDQQKIGEKIRRAREAKGYTKLQLAKMLGCTVRSVQRWEKGECIIRSEMLMELTRVLDLKMEDFYE